MAEEKKKKGGGIGELLAYAGDHKCLTYLGMGLSATSQLDRKSVGRERV